MRLIAWVTRRGLITRFNSTFSTIKKGIQFSLRFTIVVDGDDDLDDDLDGIDRRVAGLVVDVPVDVGVERVDDDEPGVAIPGPDAQRLSPYS